MVFILYLIAFEIELVKMSLLFQIWSFAGTSPLQELRDHQSCVRCSKFSSDNKHLATGDDNGEIMVGLLLLEGNCTLTFYF